MFNDKDAAGQKSEEKAEDVTKKTVAELAEDIAKEERVLKEEEAALRVEEVQVQEQAAERMATLHQELAKEIKVQEVSAKEIEAQRVAATRLFEEQKNKLSQDDKRRSLRKHEMGEEENSAETIKTAVDKIADVSEGVKTVTEILMRAHHALAVLEKSASFFPPLRLAIGAVLSGLEIFSAYYEKNISNWNRAAKVGLAIGFVAVLIAAVAVPPLAGIFVAVAAGIQMLKEYRELFTRVAGYMETRREIVHTNHHIKALNQDVLSAKSEMVKLSKELLKNPNATTANITTDHLNVLSERIAKNKLERAKLENMLPELKAQRYRRGVDAIESGTNWLLASVSLVGVVMLFFPPLSLVGLGLLVGAVGVGLAVKLATFIAKKVGTPTVPAHAQADEHLEPSLEKQLAIKPEVEPKLTAQLMMQLKNDALSQAKKELAAEDPALIRTPLTSSVSASSAKVDLQAEDEQVIVQSAPHPTIANRQKSEDDDREGEGPHIK